MDDPVKVSALKLLEVPHYPLDEELPVPPSPALDGNLYPLGRFYETLII